MRLDKLNTVAIRTDDGTRLDSIRIELWKLGIHFNGQDEDNG